jgi:PPOX class probable F420-dependent enzyme
MTDDEVAAFLNGRHTVVMSTISNDGSIHSVAMWYGLVDGVPAVETTPKSQKVQNLRRSDHLTFLIEDGETYQELRGVELVGRGEIVEDPVFLRRVAESVVDRYQGYRSDEERERAIAAVSQRRLAIRLHVEKVVTWDHSKLG